MRSILKYWPRACAHRSIHTTSKRFSSNAPAGSSHISRDAVNIIDEIPGYGEEHSAAAQAAAAAATAASKHFSKEEATRLTEWIYFEHYAPNRKEYSTPEKLEEAEHNGRLTARAELNWIADWAAQKHNAGEGPDGESVADTIRKAVVARAEAHAPLQYILGTQPFANLTITCRPPVFIPRPETESMVMWLLRKHLYKWRMAPLRILDLCSGTGCIGLTLAKYSPHWHVFSVELMPHAFELGLINKTLLNISNITMLRGNLYEPLKDSRAFGTIDLIVSNPPYITTGEFETLPKVVKLHEDAVSLVGATPSADAMEYYRAILREANHCLKLRRREKNEGLPGVVLEVGSQAGLVADLMEKNEFQDVCIHLDERGKERWVVGF